MTKEELQDTIKEVKHFAEKDGPLLDAQLRELRTQAETSWLEGMWDTAYLEYRERTPINVNPSFLLEDEPVSRNATQTDRAARLLEATAHFTISLRNGTLPADKEGPNPICMHQYTKLLGAARIPVSGRDILVQNHTARHIVVLSRRQFYAIDIIGQNGQALTAAALKPVLDTICADAEATAAPSNPTIPNISILTSDHRDAWADVYPEVQRLNGKNLQVINDSILLLVLDPQTPADLTAAGVSVLHNLGESRWFDKSIQLVVFKNATTGINMEHAGYDGQTLIRFFGDIAVTSGKLSSAGNNNVAVDPKSLNKMVWQYNEKIFVAMGRAQRDLEEMCYKMDMKAMRFSKFGKRAITKHKVSPDAFVQAAFHLAYFRTYGHIRSAYESCSMKRFYHGRTECIRSMTSPLNRFIGLTQCPPSTAPQQLEAAKAAFEAHINRAKQCQQGAGVDRHLWGMQQLAQQRRQIVANYQIPRLYSLPAWKRMRHDHLSTSNCGNDQLSFFGFGPTWSDGIGIGYIIKNDVIIAGISSFDQSAPKFVATLERTLEELLALFETQTPVRTMHAKL